MSNTRSNTYMDAYYSRTTADVPWVVINGVHNVEAEKSARAFVSGLGFRV